MITSADIRRARRRLEESQTEFAKRFGVSRSTYTRWELRGAPEKGAGAALIERVLAELAVARSEAAE